MTRALFITPLDSEFGFSLAGVSQRTVSAGEAADALSRARGEAGVGVIALDERLLEEIPEELVKELERKWEGVLVVLPAPELPGTRVEDYALELIRRTIGYHLRLS
ncbi:MAG: V-type ATP synthase subunit F [Nitrospirota bacterium]